MNHLTGNHLNDDELSAWLAGEGGGQAAIHLRQCEHCRAEANQLRDALSRYAFAVRQRAVEGQAVRLPQLVAPARRLARHRLRWASAAVFAVLLVAQSAWLLRPHPPAPQGNIAIHGPQQPPAINDDELLEAVNNDLNRDVPQALAPVSAITLARNRIAAGSTASRGSHSQGEHQ